MRPKAKKDIVLTQVFALAILPTYNVYIQSMSLSWQKNGILEPTKITIGSFVQKSLRYDGAVLTSKCDNLGSIP